MLKALKRLKRTPRKFSDRKQRIYDFLYGTPLGVLSMVDTEGSPRGSVIYFAIDEKFNLSFLTKAETSKYAALKNDGRVMLTVFEPMSQTTAQIIGTASEITDGHEVNAVASHILRASLQTSEAGIPPISKLQAGPYVAFRIAPDQIRMAVYARPDPGEYSELFETIESFNLHEP